MAKQTMAQKTQLSPELLAANQRLLALRRQQMRREPGVDAGCHQPNDSQEWPALSELPKHLGWGSAALTAVLRRRQSGQPDQETNFAYPEAQPGPVEKRMSDGAQILQGDSRSKVLAEAASVKLYPDIGLAMLRQNMTAPGRLWLMCRYLDVAGQGSLRIDIITKHLNIKNSGLYLCGKRQLRNLLRQGEEVFWIRDRETIWLRSAARVAASLDVERLTGRPVALPLDALLSGIGAFRAHLYAAFHSSRAKDSRLNPVPVATKGTVVESVGMPIARATLARISGVGQSTQRAYEMRLGLQTRANFAVGETKTEGGYEERAWQQGGALFDLRDYQGQQGREGRTYLAWQLPNSYAGQHAQRPKGRQKRINRQIQDLVMKGMPGNDGGEVVRCGPARRYFANGRLAGKTLSRQRAAGRRDCYWRGRQSRDGRFTLWHTWQQA